MPAAGFTAIPAETPGGQGGPTGAPRQETVASIVFCCTTGLLAASPHVTLRVRILPKPKQEEHVQTNSDRKSRRDRLPGHQDCAPYGDRNGSRVFRGRPRCAPCRNGR